MCSSDPYTRCADIYDEAIGDDGGLLARYIINPTIFAMLGNIKGRRVLDVCCGQGYLARELARRGAEVVAVDISAGLVTIARQKTSAAGLAVKYVLADTTQPLPLACQYHTAVCTLSLMDVYDYASAIRNTGAVLLNGGQFILSLVHPLHFHGKGYFDKETPRLHTDLAQKGMTLYYWHRPLEDYVGALAAAGFCVRQIKEPRPSLEAIRCYPEELAGRDEQPSFIVIEAVKHIEGFPCNPGSRLVRHTLPASG